MAGLHCYIQGSIYGQALIVGVMRGAQAEARQAGKEPEKKKPVVVKFGLNHVTHLVETGKAQLVVIAHDVDPIELVVWLPAVCKKMNIPYIIVKVRSPTMLQRKRLPCSLLSGFTSVLLEELSYSQSGRRRGRGSCVEWQRVGGVQAVWSLAFEHTERSVSRSGGVFQCSGRGSANHKADCLWL